MLRDGVVYRGLRWLNEHGYQTVITGILWRWRATSIDRTALKQRVRALEAEVELLRRYPQPGWRSLSSPAGGPFRSTEEPAEKETQEQGFTMPRREAAREDALAAALKDAERWLRFAAMRVMEATDHDSVEKAQQRARATLAWLRNELNPQERT